MERVLRVLASGLSSRIDRRAIKVWIISGIIKTTVFALIAAAIGLFVTFRLSWAGGWVWWLWVISGLLVVSYGVLVIGILPGLNWQRWRYEVSEHQVDLQRGVWYVRRTLIPMVRVQHVDTKQGVIMRRYGLAGVTIWTAADCQEIPALSVEAADELRDRIARLARVSDDDI
jgi:membrane protein YdbS with pleckstrin-like domain